MAVELLMRLDQSGALVPANDLEAQAMQPLEKTKGVLKVKVTQSRATLFHRKGMGLFRYLFNLWEPGDFTVDGVPVQKDYESFRESLTIQAGFFKQVFLPGGGFELRAESLAWTNMDNIRFTQVYNAVIDQGIRLIGGARHLTREQIDEEITRLLRWDS